MNKKIIQIQKLYVHYFQFMIIYCRLYSYITFFIQFDILFLRNIPAMKMRTFFMIIPQAPLSMYNFYHIIINNQNEKRITAVLQKPQNINELLNKIFFIESSLNESRKYESIPIASINCSHMMQLPFSFPKPPGHKNILDFLILNRIRYLYINASVDFLLMQIWQHI